MNKRKKMISRYIYFLIVITLSLLLEVLISPVIPIIIVFIGHGGDGVEQTIDYFTSLTMLKIIYLGIPIYLLTLSLLSVKEEMPLFRKAGIPILYGLINLTTSILFVFIIPDFKDFFGFMNNAPFLGFFYFSTVSSFVSSLIVVKIINILISLRIK